LERDVIGFSGVSAVIWLEGINDFGANSTAEAVEAGMRAIVARLRQAIPGVRVIGATVVTALGNKSLSHGSAEEDQQRRALNEFIRASGVFDGIADFDRATIDNATGEMRPEFVPDSTTGGAGDKLHPNRAGYMAMAASIDLKLLLE
jgi:lysophospholipase L1-like esterase